MRPPCAWTNPLTIARPRPVPPCSPCPCSYRIPRGIAPPRRSGRRPGTACDPGRALATQGDPGQERYKACARSSSGQCTIGSACSHEGFWRRRCRPLTRAGPITDELLIRFTPNDPRGSVRMRRVSGRGSMTAIRMPATRTGRLPGRVHVPFDRRRSPDRDGGPADAPDYRNAPRFHGLRPVVGFGVNRISSMGIMLPTYLPYLPTLMSAAHSGREP
jgi:hypothetical protein